MMPDGSEALYADAIMHHARAPRHRGALPGAQLAARGRNPLCGDECDVTVQLDGHRRIARIGFQGESCAICTASADTMAEEAAGCDEAAVAAMAAAFTQLLHGAAPAPGLPPPLRAFAGMAAYPSRTRCATLPWAALQAALAGQKEASSE